MFGFLINRVRHTKEILFQNNKEFSYYLLLTSFNNGDPFICVSVGRTEGEMYLNLDKMYIECCKCVEKVASDKQINLLGLRADEIVDLVQDETLSIVKHDFHIIF